jgi:hypothetical protein
MTTFRTSAVPLLLAILASCDAQDHTIAQTEFAVVDSAPARDRRNASVVGEDRQYVVDTLVLPSTPKELQEFSFDLDDNNIVGNQLGTVFRSLKTLSGIDLQPDINNALKTDKLVVLVNARSESIEAAKQAGTWVFVGEKNDTGKFSVTKTSKNPLLPGAVVDREFDGGPGNVALPLPLAPGTAAVEVPLIGARVRFTFGENDNLENGVLAGGISVDDVQKILLPAWHKSFASVIAKDCTGTFPACCAPNSTGGKILDFLNTDDDCTLSLEEFQSHTLIKQLFGADLDLLNGKEFGPNQDKILDSVSLGVSFTAKKATFDLPPDLRGRE